MKTTITVSNSTVSVNSPYNTDFITAARKLGGKWVSPEWEFDIRDEQRVRDLCRDVYGTDGITTDLCTIRAEFGPSDNAGREPITVFGRVVARAYGRDSGAKLGEGVVLLSGGFGSGGSMKNWETTAKNGTEVLIRDVPRVAVQTAIDGGATWLSIEAETAPVDHAALTREREKLMARIAEIDAALYAVLQS